MALLHLNAIHVYIDFHFYCYYHVNAVYFSLSFIFKNDAIFFFHMFRTPEQLIENFPEAKLRMLIAKISNPRWVVPVLPDQELECLLNYAIELTKAGKND